MQYATSAKVMEELHLPVELLDFGPTKPDIGAIATAASLPREFSFPHDLALPVDNTGNEVCSLLCTSALQSE